MENLLNEFITFTNTHALLPKHDKNGRAKILLAISGGIDSMVLLDMLIKTQVPIILAHVNFQLRSESDHDELFIRQHADHTHIPLFVKKVNMEEELHQRKCSIQECARIVRYEWFEKLRQDSSLRIKYIATAHHADDNIETVLFNFLRGTGVKGLRGIQPIHQFIVRPLLFANRKNIVDYAISNKINWVEDKTNQETDYTRNFIRNKVIPLIENKIPHVRTNLLQNINRFNEWQQVYLHILKRQERTIFCKRGKETFCSIKGLQSSPLCQTIIFEWIIPYQFTTGQINEVVKLFDAQNGKSILSPTHEIYKYQQWLVLTKRSNHEKTQFIIQHDESKIIFQGGSLLIEKDKTIPPTHEINQKNIFYLSADHIIFPLVLRKWQQGDYFYPLGLQKKKKVSRFLIDQKIKKSDKENIWVLEDSEKHILIVIPHRIDNRHKITPQTKTVIKIEYSDDQLLRR
ncbi:MAG: tRNA lysidine(34) synthetase TilS [Phycisphaerales bacterium]|nr:tRNA lysidine(34) synthetase TilS [Phycisphaerales bacterium]